jgi:hypothetical protein
MPRLLAEYVLKGVYLGLLLFVALQASSRQAGARVALCAMGGLGLALVVAAAGKLRDGFRPAGRIATFFLCVLLDSPRVVYTGIILGMLAAAYSVLVPGRDYWLLGAVAGGAILGAGLALIRAIRDYRVRRGLSMFVPLVLAVAAVAWFYLYPDFFGNLQAREGFAWCLLAGIPFFYVLTLAGEAEESEVEAGAMCATVGLALAVARTDRPALIAVAVLVPITLYLGYIAFALPRLRVFKHALCGLGYAGLGRYRPALLSLRRALELDPRGRLVRDSLWRIHRGMDFSQVVRDPDTLALMDLDLCLERASSLLVAPRPGPEMLQEARHLLDLVLSQRPTLRATIDYWRAVASTHAGLFDDAVADLEHVLDPDSFPPGDPSRQSILFSAWQLALVLHPEIKRRVGVPELALPGRRMQAIAAVERQLAAIPEDTSAWDLKRLLYAELTEADYRATAGPNQPAADFDHLYVEQLGLALIDDAKRWPRGVEYLRLAARGQPGRAPSLFIRIARAHEAHRQPDGAWDYYELARRAGRAFGPRNLGEAERQEYFGAVKLLAERARARSDLDAAIENYALYAESDRSGLETLRILADLHELKGDALGALRVTEQALLYDAREKDLLERKDRYYYSVMPEQIRPALESLGRGFDVDYCLRKARSLLDLKDADAELIDWARHLADLAQVVRPDSIAVKVLRARALGRRDREASRTLLEEVFQRKPEHFASQDDEDSWFLASRMLGEMYLYELGRPDLAVPCFTAYRKSPKSGADTLYKLGQSYEQLGDVARARKCYEHVTAYDGHPLGPDARDALYRLQSS